MIIPIKIKNRTFNFVINKQGFHYYSDMKLYRFCFAFTLGVVCIINNNGNGFIWFPKSKTVNTVKNGLIVYPTIGR